MKVKRQEIKLESGVSVVGKPGRKLKYPFPDMKVGQSFWFKTTPVNLSTSFRAWCNRHGKDWKCQSCVEINKDGIKGARIKRVK